MSKKIVAEKTEFIYLYKKDPYPLEGCLVNGLSVCLFSRNSSNPENFVLDYLDMRIILVNNPLNSKSSILYYLHWDNNQDLEELDERIEKDEFTDEDFVCSIKTFAQETLCPKCGCKYNTLVVPSGDIYTGAPGLMNDKVKNKRYKSCPSCLSSLRQLVVKIFTDLPRVQQNNDS